MNSSTLAVMYHIKITKWVKMNYNITTLRSDEFTNLKKSNLQTIVSKTCYNKLQTTENNLFYYKLYLSLLCIYD